MEPNELSSKAVPSFFDRPGVHVERLSIGPGVPVGIEQIQNPAVGIGGAYGSWGESYDNTALLELVESRLGHPLEQNERMNLVELGFQRRHHLPDLTDAEHAELELEVGTRFLVAAAQANDWDPDEIAGVIIGCSGPISETFTSEIARRAGIPESAIKVSIHKACDGSVGGLHAVLNPDLPIHTRLSSNIARTLAGKKVLVGGIEGLSRFMRTARDTNALQLFGNGAGVIGVIPGETMRFLVGKAHEVYDEEVVQTVLQAVRHFAGDLTRLDDIALIAIRRKD